MQEQILYKKVVPTKFGDMTIICSDLGVAQLLLPNSQGADEEKYLTRYFGHYRMVEEGSALCDFAAEELQNYLEGRLQHFDSPCDLRLTPFACRVLSELQNNVAYGSTTSYGELAERCGNPRAFRAVGWAMAHNPIPLIIPCHRVINANGKMGSYSGGLKLKKALLDMEKASK